MLEGSPVNLVNSRATRQVSGRKSDVLDGPWIWPLMTYGRLKGAFRSANEIGSLRSLVRQRAAQVQEQSRCVPHRQKAPTPMNSQLDAFRRSAARERRRRRKARPCATASSPCGSPGAARSARRDGRRTNVGRRRLWPSPDFLHPKSDGPYFGFREKWQRSGLLVFSSVFCVAPTVTESTRRQLPRLEYERKSGPSWYTIFRQSPYYHHLPFLWPCLEPPV